VGLLLVVSLSDNGSCAPWCTQFGGAIAGAAEDGTPLTSTLSTGPAGGGSGGSAGGQPPVSSAASSQPPTPTGGSGFPVATGVGGLIQSTSLTGSDTTPTLGPGGRPRAPAPPGVDPSLTTNPPSGTTPPPTTEPPTTVPPTTEPPTTAPTTTVETMAAPRPDRTRVAHDPFRHPAPPGAISAPPERRSSRPSGPRR
jgi:hypothetical protein